jgi:EEF1A N-terminal glycine/lysine methyltransferase
MGRILFFSRHPAMRMSWPRSIRYWLSLLILASQTAVLTIKYLVELRGWNGIALLAVHSRDAKIFIDDPGPWVMALATEARYSIRPPEEV